MTTPKPTISKLNTSDSDENISFAKVLGVSFRLYFLSLIYFYSIEIPVEKSQVTPVPPSPQYPAGFFAKYCW